MQKKIIVLLCLAVAVISTYWFFKPRGPESFATPAQRPSEAELNKAFPADSRQVFENSDSLTLYSIESMPDGRVNSFHGYPIVGETLITEPKEKSDLIAHFYNGMQGEIMHAACFNPHHAIRAIKGDKTLDLVIFFG